MDERAKIGICFFFRNFTFQWILFCLLLHVVLAEEAGKTNVNFLFTSSGKVDLVRRKMIQNKGSTNKSSTTNTIFFAFLSFLCWYCWFYACWQQCWHLIWWMPPMYATYELWRDKIFVLIENKMIKLWFDFFPSAFLCALLMSKCIRCVMKLGRLLSFWRTHSILWEQWAQLSRLTCTIDWNHKTVVDLMGFKRSIQLIWQTKCLFLSKANECVCVSHSVRFQN